MNSDSSHLPVSESGDVQAQPLPLQESAKLAWRAMCDAEAVIRTIDPESATEGEKLRALCERLTDCAMHLFIVLREPTQEWAKKTARAT